MFEFSITNVHLKCKHLFCALLFDCYLYMCCGRIHLGFYWKSRRKNKGVHTWKWVWNNRWNWWNCI